MSSLSVVIPYPPSANRLWRAVPGKGVLKSAEYRSWLQAAGAVVALARKETIAGPYALRMQVGRPDNRRRDIDNTIKPVSDALVAGCAVADDCDCQRIEAEWTADLDGIRVLVLATTRRV